jgi:hypothetical protein
MAQHRVPMPVVPQSPLVGADRNGVVEAPTPGLNA